MKLTRSAPPGHVRLWYWNSAGASSILIPRDRAAAERQRLISWGFTVWHTEVYA